MASLLQVEDLSIWFGSRRASVPTASVASAPVVSRVSFSIEAGEVLGLVGESGSGKSVTSLAILRLLGDAARVEGSIRFEGVELLTLSAEEMRRRRGSQIAMIFQEPMTALNPVMAVGEQVAEAVRVHQPRLGRREVRRAVIEAMEAVALLEPERRLKDYPHQFSGGQRQRILIAMALANRPRLLIADEPTTALDVTVQAQILELLADLRKRFGLAMLFISHDLAVVSQVASRVAVMRGGLILEQGPSAEIFRNPLHAYTRSLLGAVPTLTTDKTQPLATLRPMPGQEADTLVDAGGGHWIRRKPGGPDSGADIAVDGSRQID
ncbi:MAG TPA: ABC transporter ATP-binding protein [Acidisarcina sp.]